MPLGRPRKRRCIDIKKKRSKLKERRLVSPKRRKEGGCIRTVNSLKRQEGSSSNCPILWGKKGGGISRGSTSTGSQRVTSIRGRAFQK